MFDFKAIWNFLKRINYSKIGRGAIDFAKRNENTIVYGVGSLGLAALAKKYNIPLSDAYSAYASKDKILDFDEMQRMNQPKDAAITAMMKTGLDSYSSNIQMQSVKAIKDIVLSSDDIPDNTIAYAIRCLEKIAKKSYSSYVQTEVNKAILEIGKRE